MAFYLTGILDIILPCAKKKKKNLGTTPRKIKSTQNHKLWA